VILNTNEDYTQGILEQEHLNALKQFWQYVQDNPRKSAPISDRVAYVLPKDYGYGFRGPNDKIWGLWEADAFSYNISKNVGTLLEEYGSELDIIYDDGLEPNNTYGYSKLIYWNVSSLPPSPSPEPKTEVSLSMDYVYAIAVGAAITAVVAAALVLKKRRQHYVGVNNVAK
jgi:hypothetical protein